MNSSTLQRVKRISPVDIAVKTYTIQSAIDAGKIAVLGAGDHESLENKKPHR